MSYEVKEHDGEKCPEPPPGFDVVNVESEEVKDHHEHKPDADRQVRILDEMDGGEE